MATEVERIQKVGSSSRRVDLASATRTADDKIRTCRQFSTAISAVVDVLSGAGSDLKHVLSNSGADALKVAMADDIEIGQTVDSVLGACGGLATALVTLASTLTGELHRPLQEFEISARTERARGDTELEKLKLRHQTCAAALNASRERKERHSATLKTALQADQTNLGWFGSLAGGKAFDNTTLQEKMARQEQAVEEYGELYEDLMAVTNEFQAKTDAVANTLQETDGALKETLRLSLSHCSGAWESVTESLCTAVKRLEMNSCESGKNGSAVEARTDEQLNDVVDASGSAAACSSASVLAAEREAFETEKISWREAHEAREIELLEREESLRKMQTALESQAQICDERRKSVTLQHARVLALVDHHTSLPTGSPDTFSLDDANEEPSEATSVEQSPKQDGLHKDSECMYDLDWNELPKSTSGTILIDDRPSPTVKRSQDADVSVRLGEVARTLEAEEDDEHAKENRQPPIGCLTNGSRTTSNVNQGLAPSAASEEDSDFRDAMERRRLRLDRGEGADSPEKRDWNAQKGRMPGVHPSMAEKLEARRRVVDAAEESLGFG